jgi:hypothetical protein
LRKLSRVQKRVGQALDLIRSDDPLQSREEIDNALFWLNTARSVVGEYAVDGEVVEAGG